MQILLRLYNDVQKEKIEKYYYYFKVLTTTINAPSIHLIKTPPNQRGVFTYRFMTFVVTFRSILLSQQTKGVHKCLILILIGWHIAQK